jgi:hypothetical protein
VGDATPVSFECGRGPAEQVGKFIVRNTCFASSFSRVEGSLDLIQATVIHDTSEAGVRGEARDLFGGGGEFDLEALLHKTTPPLETIRTGVRIS